MREVENKVAFVTGGSSGIGLGIVQAFAEAGMHVAFSYRSPRHLEEAMDLLNRFADRIHPIALDVGDVASFESAAAAATNRFGKIHVLVNNAGVCVKKPLSETTHDDWEWQIRANLTGVFKGIQTFLPLIRQHREGGHVVTTSSILGLFAAPSFVSYSATKFAVIGLMEGLRIELKDTDVGVSIYCPGTVRSNLAQRRSAEPSPVSHDRSWTGGIGADYPHMEPLEAGRLVLEGIRNNDLYILSHPEFYWILKERHDAIEASNLAHVKVPEARARWATERYYTPIYSHELKVRRSRS